MESAIILTHDAENTDEFAPLRALPGRVVPGVLSPPMSQDRWTAVDRYIDDLLVRPDQVFDAVLEDAAAAGLPAISVSASQGKLLQLLARLMGARRILELGTLAGFSGIWMARALPADGRLVTIEMDPAHVEVAKRSFDKAGIAARVEIRLGAALDILPDLAREGAEPFDMVFIDADKGNYAAYLDWAIRLARPGGLIIADNVVRDGQVVDKRSDDPSVQGARRFMAALGADARVTATSIQTVGVKGYDGLAFAVVTAPTPP